MSFFYPKISIITPSYNQGQFIEETILSVIGQQYPNLEYIIIDGGSTDNTIDIIRKYESHLSYWVSEKDQGQSHAINKGFNKATGEILAWLNSDDLYFPSTLSYIANTVRLNEPVIYFGNSIHFEEKEAGLVSYGSNVLNGWAKADLGFSDYIIQPSSFWTSSALKQVGELREDLHYGFDWEWFLRAQIKGMTFHGLSKCLSMYRFHSAHKTGKGGRQRQQELLSIYKDHSPEAGNLFQLLISETADFDSNWNRLIIRFFQKLCRSHSYGDIIKRIKPAKYRPYSVKQINEVRSML